MLGEGDRRKAVVEGYVTFPFAPCAEGELASGDDEVYIYAYCPELEEGVLSAAAWRRMGRVTLALPERWQDKEVHFYGFAVSYEGEASATTYLGMLAATPSVETQPAASPGTTQKEETRLAASLQREQILKTIITSSGGVRRLEDRVRRFPS